jgi:hypothetical protein
MFFLAPAPGRRSSAIQLWGLALGVPSVVLGLLGVPGVLGPGALAVAAAAVSHAAWVAAMARGRKRPGLDWGLRLTLTATVFVLPAIVLGLALAADRVSGPRVALAYAVLVLGGFVSLTIAGMTLKIVPFLVWYHTFAPRAGRERVPTLAELSWPRLEGAACVLLTGGVGLLAGAVFVGDVTWIRAAASVLALGAAAFALAVARVLGHLRPRLRHRAEDLGTRARAGEHL